MGEKVMNDYAYPLWKAEVEKLAQRHEIQPYALVGLLFEPTDSRIKGWRDLFEWVQCHDFATRLLKEKDLDG